MGADQDTAGPGGPAQFPATAWSLVERLRDPKAPEVRAYLDRMIRMYWRPVFRFVRVSWKRSDEDAKDLTQAFFIHLLEGKVFAHADPERGNFRKLLLASLRNFLSNEARAAAAAKRGGGRRVVSLDDNADPAGSEDPADPQALFETQWARAMLDRAMHALRSGSRPEVYAAFEKFHLQDVPVNRIAAELGVSVSQVGHFLHDARAALRRFVTDEIRQYVRDEEEIGRELELLFQGWR
ncbi:MAG TPA: sigma-70 family RNA polymerase sigma factor [Planctomycetota bacterium]